MPGQAPGTLQFRVSRVLAGGLPTFGDDHRAQSVLFDRPVQNVIDEHIAILAILFDLMPCPVQPILETNLRHSALSLAAIPQSQGQYLRVRRKNKNADRLRYFAPYLCRALDVDIEQQVAPMRNGIGQALASGPVVVAEDVGMLPETRLQLIICSNFLREVK